MQPDDFAGRVSTILSGQGYMPAFCLQFRVEWKNFTRICENNVTDPLRRDGKFFVSVQVFDQIATGPTLIAYNSTNVKQVFVPGGCDPPTHHGPGIQFFQRPLRQYNPGFPLLVESTKGFHEFCCKNRSPDCIGALSRWTRRASPVFPRAYLDGIGCFFANTMGAQIAQRCRIPGFLCVWQVVLLLRVWCPIKCDVDVAFFSLWFGLYHGGVVDVL